MNSGIVEQDSDPDIPSHDSPMLRSVQKTWKKGTGMSRIKTKNNPIVIRFPLVSKYPGLKDINVSLASVSFVP